MSSLQDYLNEHFNHGDRWSRYIDLRARVLAVDGLGACYGEPTSPNPRTLPRVPDSYGWIYILAMVWRLNRYFLCLGARKLSRFSDD